MIRAGFCSWIIPLVGRLSFARRLGEMGDMVVEAQLTFCEEGTNCITFSRPELVDTRRLNAFRGGGLIFLKVK